MREERARLRFSLLSGYNQEGYCAAPNDLSRCLFHQLSPKSDILHQSNYCSNSLSYKESEWVIYSPDDKKEIMSEICVNAELE